MGEYRWRIYIGRSQRTRWLIKIYECSISLTILNANGTRYNFSNSRWAKIKKLPFFFFVAAPGFSCGTQDLSCSTWDLFPWPRVKPPAPLHLEHRVLATGPAGKSLRRVVPHKVMVTRLSHDGREISTLWRTVRHYLWNFKCSYSLTYKFNFLDFIL